jgi:hypothetical protein
MSHKKPQALLQAILRVQAGTLTAKAAAQELGLSRKTYHQWETRALAGMITALTPGQPGRPPRDREALRTAAEMDRLRQTCSDLEQRLHIREVLSGADTRSKKKQGRDGRVEYPPAPT